MPTYLKNDDILLQYPYSDQSGSKLRPGVVIGAPHPSQDIFVVPLTTHTASLQPLEFVLADWKRAGLRAPSAVKRAIYTTHQRLIGTKLGKLSIRDEASLEASLRHWLDLP